MTVQLALPLAGGYHCGPLFEHGRVRRAPKRPPGSTTAPGRLRRAAEVRATPAWADRSAIRAMFARAERLTRATGRTHSVDHIVPLQHPLVCGLHVEHNMRVITLAENMRKGNRAWPDAWGAQLPLAPLEQHPGLPPIRDRLDA